MQPVRADSGTARDEVVKITYFNVETGQPLWLPCFVGGNSCSSKSDIKSPIKCQILGAAKTLSFTKIMV